MGYEIPISQFEHLMLFFRIYFQVFLEAEWIIHIFFFLCIFLIFTFIFHFQVFFFLFFVFMAFTCNHNFNFRLFLQYFLFILAQKYFVKFVQIYYIFLGLLHIKILTITRRFVHINTVNYIFEYTTRLLSMWPLFNRTLLV